MSKLLTTKLETFKNYVGGNWMDSSSHRTFKSINPSNTDDIVGIFQASNEEDVKVAIETANTAFSEWANTAPSKRAAILNKAADILESRIDQLASELTREEGKPINDSIGEVKRSAQTLRYYAVSGQNIKGDTLVNDDPN